jgi:hypothetical protein
MSLAEDTGAQSSLDNFIALRRPDDLTLTNLDFVSRDTLSIFVEQFKSWLEERELFEKRATNYQLGNSLAWLYFVNTLDNMGYLPADHNLVPRDQQPSNRAYLEGRASVHISKRDFVITSVARDSKGVVVDEEEGNLLDVFYHFLREQVANKNYPLSTATENGRHSLLLYFIADMKTIANEGDDETTFVAKPFLLPPPKRVLKLDELQPVEPQPTSKTRIQWEEPAASEPEPTRVKKQKSEFGASFFRITHATTKTFVRSAIGGALLTTASRVAIVGGLGMFGVGAVPAGIGAGIAIGAWKVYSNYRKHGSIAQAAFGTAATAGGVALGAIGVDALIEPFKETLEPLAQEWIINPLRNYVINPVGQAVSTLVIDPIKNNIIDPVSNHFANQASLIDQVETLKGENRLLRAHLDAVTGNGAVPVEDANAAIEDRRIEPNVVKTIRIGPDGEILDNVSSTVIGPLSDNGGAAINAVKTVDVVGPAFTTHVIGGKDSLSTVVAQTYGVKGSALQDAMKRVITANPEIASNPSMLLDGKVLKLPTNLSDVAEAQCNERRFRLGRPGACVVPKIS